jgi:hypothetical protein
MNKQRAIQTIKEAVNIALKDGSFGLIEAKNIILSLDYIETLEEKANTINNIETTDTIEYQ